MATEPLSCDDLRAHVESSPPCCRRCHDRKTLQQFVYRGQAAQLCCAMGSAVTLAFLGFALPPYVSAPARGHRGTAE